MLKTFTISAAIFFPIPKTLQSSSSDALAIARIDPKCCRSRCARTAEKFGSQCIVIAIDAKLKSDKSGF